MLHEALHGGFYYMAKNHEFLKTGLNNVVLPTLFNVVNNIEQQSVSKLIGTPTVYA